MFQEIYEKKLVKDEDKSFNEALKILDEDIGKLINEKTDTIELYNKYKEYFNPIREKLSKNENRAKEFIQNFEDYYDIKNKIKDEKKYKTLINELTILFKSKNYQVAINSIIFFFEYFQKDNVDWNKKLSKELNYKDLSKKDLVLDFKDLRKRLKELKDNEIYDYENIKDYNKLFTCLNDKKEAIDYLFSKTEKASKDIDNLKDKIQPTDRTISIKDIEDTEECIYQINEMKKLKDNFKILNYIKSMKDKTISKFENYSKIYSSVIDLENNSDISENVYDKVIKRIQDATFNILQDTENFLYKYKDKKGENRCKTITMEQLVHLKNKIQIKDEDENIIENEDDKIKSKCYILRFFKKTISDLEVINEYMKVLRTKGSSLPINITIRIRIEKNKPIIEYKLEEEKINDPLIIRDFLFNAKNKYISQLITMYREKSNLRFLYGKQFRSIMKHIVNDLNIDSFLRYILNNTDNNKPINEGYKALVMNVTNYIKEYEIYNKNSLENISTYITSLFKNNGKTEEDHYDRMRIISNKTYKGIYLYECENNSMEEFIINLSWDKINKLPIAQNVLITNKETSYEEFQAFFNRAILCNYNTLFFVEINDSFSNYQQSIMNSCIDDLLTFKKEKYDEENKENVNKKKTQDYLDSCIVFVYSKNNNNITPFLNEIKKLEYQQFQENDINKKNKEFLSELDNIMLITSDKCGLGKSEKIKKIIKDKNKKYFHFPLGGILSKNIIFDKLENLLSKMKNEKYENIAIHLDLTESKETSIINEFFFSFLITKFYTNNENIIYIPKDISIYIEIPNCFENYLSKFNILNIFNKENIELDNMPKFNYPDEIINIFNRMLLIKSNEEIQKFVKDFIGIPKYSYHQINIFIKLFISQYNKFESKLKFLSNGKDVTNDCIREFAKCTHYFTNGGFSRLLIGIDNNEKKDYIDKLSEIYDNDLQNMKFESPLIFIIKEKMKFDKLFIPTKDSKESEKYKYSKDYLNRIKAILNLPNPVEKPEGKLKSLLSIIEEKNNNYVITNDNFKKMVLLVYRIKANVPVIIMGDTGCGKTALIIKLNQILNNGETTVKIVNIHPGITDEILCKKMKEIDELAKKQKDKNR